MKPDDPVGVVEVTARGSDRSDPRMFAQVAGVIETVGLKIGAIGREYF